MNTAYSPRPLIAAFAAVALLVGTAQAADRVAASKNVRAASGTAIVTVKFVPQAPTGDKGPETETSGVMISADGLVLCSNVKLGGNPFGNQGVTPTELKVLIGDDTEGVAAEVINRDSERDLVWLQITEMPEEAVEFIDMSKAGAELQIGQEVYSVRLMHKYFGRTPYVGAWHIGARLTQPRDLYATSLRMEEGIDFLGMPVFTDQGAVLGVLIVQLPDEEARRAGAAGQPRDVVFVLPASSVASATELAKQLYEERKAEEAAAAEAAEEPADAVAEEAEAESPDDETAEDME